MKVLHTISEMSIRSGGPSLSTFMLLTGLRRLGVVAELATYANMEPGNHPITRDEYIHFLRPPKSTRYGYSREFNNFFATRRDIDIFHAHGLWQYAMHSTAKWAQKVKKPYLITPRGMLYPEGLRKSSLFKKVAMSLYQKSDLQRASCIHATCEQEYRYIRECCITNPPIAIIPNAVDVSKIISKTPEQYGSKRVGYLGRFAPIKNLETLIKAWAKSNCSINGWELLLVGDGDAQYRRSLEDLAFNDLGLKNVKFTGFLSGDEKDEVFSSLNCLVLPSKSENFGMVVPEALARGVPVIASKGTPWEELKGSQIAGKCGWWVDHNVDALQDALTEMGTMNCDDVCEMGRNGRRLVESRYSILAVAEQMVDLYKWLIDGGTVPHTVIEH